MASYNKVILAGNLTRDPDLRMLPSGMAVAKFAIAVNRRYTTKEGDQRDEVTYIEIDSFGKQAETIAKYCTKGSGILVEGRLKLDQWDDKTSGEKRSRLGVVLEGFTFLGGRPGGASSEGSNQGYEENSPPRRSAAPAAPRSQPPPQSAPSIDDDVPF
ncbi:MAG: single-stranded DNA-binding protein [Puniceicoccales bacterium]|jgi:single-strand DNA-binding protein|nr:single-stranded DNA-binding protein [Puniceicoccales bacterium]